MAVIGRIGQTRRSIQRNGILNAQIILYRVRVEVLVRQTPDQAAIPRMDQFIIMQLDGIQITQRLPHRRTASWLRKFRRESQVEIAGPDEDIRAHLGGLGRPGVRAVVPGKVALAVPPVVVRLPDGDVAIGDDAEEVDFFRPARLHPAAVVDVGHLEGVEAADAVEEGGDGFDVGVVFEEELEEGGFDAFADLGDDGVHIRSDVAQHEWSDPTLLYGPVAAVKGVCAFLWWS